MDSDKAKRLATKTSFQILAISMKDMGLDPDEVYDSAEAVQAIYDKLKVDGIALEFECNSCGGDVPDVESCPFCGVSFDEGEGVGQSYVGARKGRRPRNHEGVSGPKLFRLLLEAMNAERKFVKWQKSVVSLWSENGNGMLARCFIGAYSVRVQLPFGSEKFKGHSGKVYDYERPVKNMVSRVILEGESDIGAAKSILTQTEKLKAAVGKRTNRKKPIPPMTKPKVERRHRTVDNDIPDFSGLK